VPDIVDPKKGGRGDLVSLTGKSNVSEKKKRTSSPSRDAGGRGDERKWRSLEDKELVA